MARPRPGAAGGYERLWLGGPEAATNGWRDVLVGRAVALVLAPRVLLIVRPRGGRLVEAR